MEHQKIQLTSGFFRNILFVFVFKSCAQSDSHSNKEVIFLWQVLQLIRYSSESIALMKAGTVRKTDKQFSLPAELWQLLYFLLTFINRGNSFIQQAFTTKNADSSQFVETKTLNLIAEVFRCLLVKKTKQQQQKSPTKIRSCVLQDCLLGWLYDACSVCAGY